jgi:hypothetical protein
MDCRMKSFVGIFRLVPQRKGDLKRVLNIPGLNISFCSCKAMYGSRDMLVDDNKCSTLLPYFILVTKFFPKFVSLTAGSKRYGDKHFR